jgi:signal transduction histidine kinase
LATAELNEDAYDPSMDRLREGRDRFALRRLDIALGVTAAALGLLTAIVYLDPALSFALIDRSLDIAINSFAVLAAGGLAALALARYRESGRVAGLFQSSAFLVMGWVTFVGVALVLLKWDGFVDLTLGIAEQSQLPMYVWSISRIVAAALLVVGGITALSPMRRLPRTRRLLLMPIFGVTALAILLYPLRDLLPPFVSAEGMQALIEEPRVAHALPGLTPTAFLLQALAGGLFLLGVLFYRRSYLRDGPVADGYLAMAMLLAVFGEIHSMFYPAGVYTGLVTTSDAIRLAFFLVLLLGINAEARSDLRALRGAYASLDRLRLSEAERATLEERARLARELHDGLAQDLWFAKLKHERMVSQLHEDERRLAEEVGQALDNAIVEARQAVVTMREATDRERPLDEVLGEAVADFASRSGLRADFAAADLPAHLPPRTQVEVLRVLQEALTNVSKHADATVVRVTAEAVDGTLVMRVIDNGRGFRPEETSGDGLGVQGMKERARLMGGELRVVSQPSGGTAVRLTVPTEASA